MTSPNEVGHSPDTAAAPGARTSTDRPSAGKQLVAALVGAVSVYLIGIALPGAVFALIFSLTGVSEVPSEALPTVVISGLLGVAAIIATWFVFRWCERRWPWLVALIAIVGSYVLLMLPIPFLIAGMLGGQIQTAYIVTFAYSAIIGSLVWWLLARVMPKR